MSSRMRACFVTVVFAVAVPAAAENRLVNPDFDADLASWTASAPGGWSYLSGGWPTGVFTPGSARAVNTGAAAMTDLKLTSACVPVEPYATYLAAFKGFIPTGQATTGLIYMRVATFTNTDCTGSSYTRGYLGLTTPGTLWQPWWTWHTVNAGFHSGRVELIVRKNEAGGVFEGRVDAIYLGPPTKGDFDRDGRPDLVFDNLSSDQYMVWFMAKERQAGAATIFPSSPGPEWKLAVTDDFDGDGDTDLIFRNTLTGETNFWLMSGVNGILTTAVLSGAPSPEWTLSAAADFDHDGRPDLLWRNEATQALEIWGLEGPNHTSTLIPTPDHAADPNWSCVAAFDADRDGNTDLLWYNAVSGKVVIWYMDANVVRLNGAFTSPDSAGDNNWKVVAAGDYAALPDAASNGVDLVWRNESSGKLVMWFMDKNGVRVSGVFTTPSNPQPALGSTVVGPR